MTTELLVGWSVAAAFVTNAVLWGSTLLTCASRRRSPAPTAAMPAVTLIRPFRGLEEDALEKNLSLVRQSVPDLEVLFVCEDDDDPGLPAARKACEAAPERARVLIARDVPRVLSGKVRNMIAGWRASRAPLVAFCDADIHLEPDDLASCVRNFEDPSVGASWMFVVFEEEGLHGALWKLITVGDGLPVMSAAGRVGLRQSLQGGLMVLRRDALEAAGGVEQLGDTFADDVRAGRVLQRAGWRLRASERLLHHPSPREPLVQWLQRFHRWTLCFRCEEPLVFYAQLALHATAIPLLVTLLAWGSPGAAAAAAVLGASVLLRTAGAFAADHLVLRPRGARLGATVLLRPFADLLFFVLGVAAIVFPFVRWRGRWYRVGWDGRIVQELSAPTTTKEEAAAPEEDRGFALTRSPGSSD